MVNEENQKGYTREFKIKAVKLSYNSDKSGDDIVESLRVSKSSLHRWRNEFQEDPDQVLEKAIKKNHE